MNSLDCLGFIIDNRPTVVWIKQESRRKYWANRSSVRSSALTAHSFTCSGLLSSLAPSAALTRLLARSLCSLPRSREREFWMSQNDQSLSHSAALAVFSHTQLLCCPRLYVKSGSIVSLFLFFHILFFFFTFFVFLSRFFVHFVFKSFFWFHFLHCASSFFFAVFSFTFFQVFLFFPIRSYLFPFILSICFFLSFSIIYIVLHCF